MTRWSTATSLQSRFRLFSCINVVGYDAIVVYHSIALGLCSPEQQCAWRQKMTLLSIILTTAGVSSTEDVRGTLATRFHGVPGSWDSVPSMPIVIHGYSYDSTDFKPPAAAGFDGNTNPITTVGISLEIVPHFPSKRSTSIALAL